MSIPVNELESLTERALALANATDSVGVQRAALRLHDAADALHAVLLRQDVLNQVQEVRDVLEELHPDPAATEVEVPATTPAPPPSEASEPDPDVTFRVRPKLRKCPECGGKMWRGPGGWTCDQGHSAAD